MLKVFIADDEPPARKRLRKLLEPLADAGRVTIVGEGSDGVETLEALRAKEVDVLFLDVRMPELDGFDVLERIEPERRPVVVFTTAYDAYALRAFEANAVDYLLKPIARDRLEQAVSRAERLHTLPEQQDRNNERLSQLLDWVEQQVEQSAPKKEADPPAEYLRQISIPYRDRILVIPAADLITAEISEGITRLFVLDEDETPGPKTRLRQHVVSYTLDQLESHLDPDAFMRVHRSAIVQLDHIRELVPWFSGRYKLILTGQHEVIASRERSKLLKDRLML